LIAAASAALCPASFGTFLWLFFAYFSSHPAKPNAALGFVHALNHHGSYVYLSDAESTGLALLMMTARQNTSEHRKMAFSRGVVWRVLP
jgi:hypothetical protein